MADFVFNVAKGRVVEFYNRVKSNDPANSAFIAIVLATSGLETDAVLKDLATFTALVAGATNEVTNTNYARKTLTDSDLAALPSPDNTNDRYDIDLPDLTWSAIAAGDGWSKLVIGYDNDTTSGTDANIIPCTAHDFVVTPDGSDITAAESTTNAWWIMGAVISAGHTISIGIASETDNSFTVSKAKLKTLGIANEIDSSITFSKSKLKSITIATESNVSISFGHQKTKLIGLATETDSTFTCGRQKSRILGISTETDSDFSVSKLKNKAINLATEIDSSIPIGIGGIVTQINGTLGGITSENSGSVSIVPMRHGQVTVEIFESGDVS